MHSIAYNEKVKTSIQTHLFCHLNPDFWMRSEKFSGISNNDPYLDKWDSIWEYL